MIQSVRLHEINRRLSAGEQPNSVTLSMDLEVSRRQIFTDIATLREMGAPVKYDASRRSWYYSDPTYILPAMRLSEGELLAFFLSVEIARSSGNAGFREPLQKAVAKIAGNLGDFVSVDLNALGAATSYSFSPAASVDAETYLQLHRAGAGRRKVRMRYYTARSGQWNIRVVHPYHLHFARGDWLLFAFDEDKEKEKILSFNIARISQLDTLDDHFQVRPDFDAKEYVRTMFFAERGHQSFEVAVRFDEYQTRYIKEREWHPDQILTPTADGGSILRFPASGLAEIARWVLGYGRHAQVLEPPELISLVQSHITELAQIYSGQPASHLESASN